MAKLHDWTVPNWVVYPKDDWIEITPQEAGLDPRKFTAFLSGLNPHGASTVARTTRMENGARSSRVAAT